MIKKNLHFERVSVEWQQPVVERYSQHVIVLRQKAQRKSRTQKEILQQRCYFMYGKQRLRQNKALSLA